MSSHMLGDAFERACIKALSARWSGCEYIHTKLDSVHGIDFALKLAQGHIAIVEVKSATGTPKYPQMSPEWIHSRMLPHLLDEVIFAFRNRKKVFRATYRVKPKDNFDENDPGSYSIRSAGPTSELYWADLFPGEPEPTPENFQVTSQQAEAGSHQIIVIHHTRCGTLHQKHEYCIAFKSISKAVYDGTMKFYSFPFRIPHSHTVFENGKKQFVRELSEWNSHLAGKSSLASDNVEKRNCKQCHGIFYCTSDHSLCYPCNLSQSKKARSKALNLCDKVESISRSTNWREATPNMKAAQSEWKQIEGLSKQDRDELWPRFQKAVQYYFDALSTFHNEQDKKRKENKSKAMALISKARELSSSKDWKSGTPRAKELQKQWKSLGQLPKDDRERLWNEFNSYISSFFQNKGAHYELLEKQRQQNKHNAQALIEEAGRLSTSTNWKEAGQKIKTLQKKWKEVGPLPREDSDKMWRQFRNYTQKFFDSRSEYFARQDQVRVKNKKNAESLVRQAEDLSQSHDWKETGNRIKQLRKEWKGVNPLPRDCSDHLWTAFNRAIQVFYDRRQEYFDNLHREQDRNTSLKQQLVDRAGDLIYSSDLRSATNEVNGLQKEWKSIGRTSKEDADRLWKAFRYNCDKVFVAYGEHKKQRLEEWRRKTQNALERAREAAARIEGSIDHDESNIDRWENTIANLNPGGRASDIRYSLEQKISSVKDKIYSKRQKLEDIYRSIRDMESKL